MAAAVLWAVIGVIKGSLVQKEFEGAVRSLVLLNPRMGDEEFLGRLRPKADELGVTYADEDILIHRGMAGIHGVDVRYTMPMQVTLVSWKKTVATSVDL